MIVMKTKLNELVFKRNSLRLQAQLVQERILHKTQRWSVRKLFNQFYLPTLRSTITLVFIVFTLAVFIHFGQFMLPNIHLPVIYQETRQFQIIINVLTGISGIIFSLVIFIAQSMRDDDLKDKARVLLKESFLYPLTLSLILILVSFLWGNVNYFSYVVVIALAIATIIAIFNIISMLMSKHKYYNKRLLLLQERLDEFMYINCLEYIGNTLLNTNLKQKNIRLKYHPTPFVTFNKSDFYLFDTDKDGLIVDIRIDKLIEFSDYIDNLANLQNLRWESLKDEAGTHHLSSDRTYTPFKNRFILNRFHDVISLSSNNRCLIAIDRRLELTHEQFLHLSSLINQTFIIEKGTNFSELIHYELEHVFDQLQETIEHRMLGKLEELLQLHLTLTESYFVFMQNINHQLDISGIDHTDEHLKDFFTTDYMHDEDVTTEDWLRWQQLKWLVISWRDIQKKAHKMGDTSLIRVIAYFPLKVSLLAIKYRNIDGFREFSSFLPAFTSSAIHDDISVNKYLLGKYCSTALIQIKEVFHFIIENYAKSPDVDFNLLKNSLIHCLVLCISVLQNMYIGDRDAFIQHNCFKQELNAFELYLKQQISETMVSEADKTALQNAIKTKCKLLSFYIESMYAIAFLDTNLIKNILSVNKLFKNIDDQTGNWLILTDLLHTSCKSNTRNLFGWKLWNVSINVDDIQPSVVLNILDIVGFYFTLSTIRFCSKSSELQYSNLEKELAEHKFRKLSYTINFEKYLILVRQFYKETLKQDLDQSVINQARNICQKIGYLD